MSRVIRYIDPRVDFVVKRLFKKKRILLSLIRAVLAPYGIVVTEIVNMETIELGDTQLDKTVIYDVLVKLQDGTRVIVEMQVSVSSYLSSRMLYYFSKQYVSVIERGEEYSELRPVHSIWLLCNTMYNNESMVHHFQPYDKNNGVLLSDHMNIFTIELPKSPAEDKIETELDWWIYFFENGRKIDPRNPPKALQNDIMQEVFEVMAEISEKEKAFNQYFLREERLREAMSYEKVNRRRDEQLVKERLRADKAEAWAIKERSERQAAEAEIERLRKLLEQQ